MGLCSQVFVPVKERKEVKIFARKYSYISGFTLAEVLITLLIIGVVSSLVIPAIMNDTQEAEYRAAWKKAYAEVDQATRLIMMDNGGILKGLCNNGDDNCLRNNYAAFLSYTKKCNDGETAGICWHSANNWKTLKGDPLNWGLGAGLVLSNGTLFFTSLISKNCSTPYGIFNICGEMAVDINGFKGPNQIGKDIFYTHILENSTKPFGVQGDGLETSCSPTNTGMACAAKYLYQ
jgi:prepilin-type N-terminal cleavage/methylation domain-containing protein